MPLQQRVAPPLGGRTTGVWLQAAAAVLVLVGVGLAVSLARTTAALNSALNERAEQEQRADEAARTAQGLERRVADLEARVDEQSSASAAARTSTDPVVPATVFALTAVRGGERKALPPSSRSIARTASSTSARVNQRASSSSVSSTFTSGLSAKAWQPIISEEGNGHGWLTT